MPIIALAHDGVTLLVEGTADARVLDILQSALPGGAAPLLAALATPELAHVAYLVIDAAASRTELRGTLSIDSVTFAGREDLGDHDGETVMVRGGIVESGDHDGETVMVRGGAVDAGNHDSGDHDGETVMVRAGASKPGDHDGETVVSSALPGTRGTAPRTVSPPPLLPRGPSLMVTLPNGTVEPLTQPLVIGRSPSVSQVAGGAMPKLISIGSADQDLSRTHARIAVEGGTVVVTDLHSRNGTTVAMPGREPQQLRAGEPTAVLVGTIIDFGGGLAVTVGEK